MTKRRKDEKREEGGMGERKGGRERERENKRMSPHKGHQVDAPS